MSMFLLFDTLNHEQHNIFSCKIMSELLNHDSELSDWLEFLKIRSDKRQYVLHVEDQKLFVNKRDLAECGHFFSAATLGDFKEAHQNYMDMPDKKLLDILEFLACFMPIEDRAPREITAERVEKLWKLADEFSSEVCQCIEFNLHL